MNALTDIIRDRQKEDTSLAAPVRDASANGVAEQQAAAAGKSAPPAFGGRDTVAISGEGRARLRADEDKNRVMGAVAGNGMSVSGSGEEETVDDATRLKQSLMKQIKEVKKKLQEAQQRLAETAAKVGGASGETNGEAGLAMTAQAVSGMNGTAEAEAARQEVTQLQAQLQELYNQLQQLTQSGSSGGAGGTAGIGGESNGPSGQGERIAVSA